MQPRRLSRLALALAPLVVATACGAPDGAALGSQDLTAGAACLPTLQCAAPTLLRSPARPWHHPIKSRIDIAEGAPRHRGRDLFLTPGEPQTIVAKFAYGVFNKNLKDEEVDIFVQRDCDSDWEKLGTAVTGQGGTTHTAVEGISDPSGRIFFTIPASKALSPGRHRLRLVVAGDRSSTDMFLDIVPRATPIFVSDVDGTLTSSENIEFLDLLTGTLPETHDGAPEALQALTAKGYRPMYLTARPEWLVERTRAFLDARGFPPGVVHTSTSGTGAGFGSAATAFKQNELAMLAARGLVPGFAFGNMPSDSEAYRAANIEEGHRIFFQIEGAFAGRRITSYRELLPTFDALAAACR